MTMKIMFISLGCDKNLVDSEKMSAGILDAGFDDVAFRLIHINPLPAYKTGRTVFCRYTAIG